MKILFISGSPKKGDNVKMIEYGAAIAKEKGADVSVVSLAGKKISGCVSCDYCKKSEGCSIKDDMESIRPMMESADGIIFSTPVYFGSMSGQMKCMLDRTLTLRRHGMQLKNKIGACFAVGRSRNGGQELAISHIHAFMHIHGMIVVGDDSHFGGIVVFPFEKDEEGKKTIERTVNKVVEVLKMIK
jgi:multimeric flavodoxin WrbA